jgi:hypothetical protein
MAEQESAEATEDAPQPLDRNLAFVWARRLTEWMPIVGRLWQCNRVHLKEAFYEVGCVILFSTLPLWFFPLISWFMFTVGFSMSETVQNGELLIYAASFSGTMVYFISKRYGTFQTHSEAGEGPPLAIGISFPYGGLFVIVSALICMFSAAGFFILKTFERLPHQDVLVLSVSGASKLSWVLFSISSVLFYCAVAYRNMLDESRGFRLPPERDVMDAWKEVK